MTLNGSILRVSGTRGPSQIRTDLTDLADGLNGSIRICNLWTQDICKLRIIMDPISAAAGSVRSVRIWLGPRVPDTRILTMSISIQHLFFAIMYNVEPA